MNGDSGSDCIEGTRDIGGGSANIGGGGSGGISVDETAI